MNKKRSRSMLFLAALVALSACSGGKSVNTSSSMTSESSSVRESASSAESASASSSKESSEAMEVQGLALGNSLVVTLPEKTEERQLIQLTNPPADFAAGKLLNLKLSNAWSASIPPQVEALKATEAASESAQPQKISLELAQIIQSVLPEKSIRLIDVRTDSEYAEGHLAGAVNLPVESLADAIKEQNLAKDTTLIVYCRSGNRSVQAAKTLTELGFSLVFDAGGVSGTNVELVK